MAEDSQKKGQGRRPYVPPAIEEEKVFERQALQACDKTPEDGDACSDPPPPPILSPNVS